MGGEEMTTLLLSIITLACVVLVIVLIYVLLELRQATQKLEQFITTSETSLKPTLDELPVNNQEYSTHCREHRHGYR